MHLLIYASSETPAGPNLLEKIHPTVKETPIDIFDSLDNLTQYLRRPITTRLLAVLLPKNNKELSILIQMRHLLRDMRIVLVLPDRKGKTISDGHILRPRYVSYGDGDLSDVIAVIQKMSAMNNSCLMQVG